MLMACDQMQTSRYRTYELSEWGGLRDAINVRLYITLLAQNFPIE